VRSLCRREQLTYENVPVMWLLGRQHPDHSTLVLNEKLERVLAEMEQEIESEEEDGAGDAQRMPEALRNPKVLHAHVHAALEELDRREERRRANKAGAGATGDECVSHRCFCVSSGERQLSLSGGTDPSAGISDASEDKREADSL